MRPSAWRAIVQSLLTCGFAFWLVIVDSFQPTRSSPNLISLDDDDDGMIANNQRRRFFQSCISTVLGQGLLSSPVLAEEGEPATPGPAASGATGSAVRGPIELLRPATRVRLFVNEAVSICKDIKARSSATVGTSESPSALQPLSDFLLQDGRDTSFMTPEEVTLSKTYLQIDTSTAWQNARRKEREARGAEMGIDYTTTYDKVNTAFQQWGDRRQFQILRSRQQSLERSSAIRAAFNAYTNNLVFGDAYRLNIDGAAKKALIRTDALPNVNAVVVSDLDLRDLYRNQVLQNMDDATAELGYQLKTGDVDVDEILRYLLQAQESCNEWFGFIPAKDVEESLRAVLGNDKQ